jgi:3-methyl-2-oxobutanoate hydroxymethyltransferase
MVTCYDYSFATILNESNIDMILVGDSMANVLLGYKDTKEISFSEMLNHTRAVREGAPDKFIVADMPYKSYQKKPKDAVDYAERLIGEGGADAVKIEWFDEAANVTEQLIRNNIAVMGHIGLTPQTADQLGGFRVQGKKVERALELIEQALTFQEKGAFSVVSECIPRQLSEIITKKLSIPNIGIGAGLECDGQVLVIYDLLGLYPGHAPKFVKQYLDLRQQITHALELFNKEVKEDKFPAPQESFDIDAHQLDRIKKLADK